MSHSFSWKKGETACEWLARLVSIEDKDLTSHERYVQSMLKGQAEGVVKREDQAARDEERTHEMETVPTLGTGGGPVAETPCLEQAKQAYRQLADVDREQFILWLASGEK